MVLFLPLSGLTITRPFFIVLFSYTIIFRDPPSPPTYSFCQTPGSGVSLTECSQTLLGESVSRFVHVSTTPSLFDSVLVLPCRPVRDTWHDSLHSLDSHDSTVFGLLLSHDEKFRVRRSGDTRSKDPRSRVLHLHRKPSGDRWGVFYLYLYTSLRL